MVKRKTTSEESTRKDDKKRALARGKANAKKWSEGLKRGPGHTEGPPTPTNGERPSATKLREVPKSKTEKREESRKRAQKYAQKLSMVKSGGESDDGDSGSDDMETCATRASQPGDPLPTSPPRTRPAVPRTSNHHAELIARLQPPPPMPETSPSEPSRPSARRHVQSSRIGASPSPSQRPTSSRSYTFLQHGVKGDGADNRGDKGAVAAASALDGGPASTGVPRISITSGPAKRPTFLRHAPENARRPEAMALPVRPAAAAVVETTDAGVDDASPPENYPRQGRAGIWAFSCAAVVLAPILSCCLLWGVRSGVVLAWPRVQLAAEGTLGALAGLTAKSSVGDKCFILPSEQEQVATICKAGTEPTECPEHANCVEGAIRGCNSPFTVAKDRMGCVLAPEAQEEATAVVQALRMRTIEQLCKGSGVIMPKTCSTRSFMTLAEAATVQNRGPLSLLASMPPGNIAGLIELEGEPAREDVGGSGMERVAQLSESAHDAVMLTPSWRCRARLAAGRWLLAYWLYCLGFYALILAIVCWDLRRLKNYRKRVQVCAMRDECYQALFDANASPLQVSHIQEHVGDRRRASEGGSRAATQRKVRELWPLVEKEVAHDTRILRNFKNIRGQHNVACWCWTGPRYSGFGSVGALDPGPAPCLWLLRWLRSPTAAP
ncbi:unnamed protein product [Scytosiphon promiscuus]